MNFTLKALVAAAALVAAGSANAAYNKASTGDGELALYVYDTVSKNTFGFDLTNNGTEQYTTKSILTASDASWSLSGSAWDAFRAAFGTAPADTLKWAIWSGDSTGTSPAAGTNVLGVTAKAGTDVVNFGVTNANFKNAVGAGGVGKDNGIAASFTPTTAVDSSFFSTSATANYLTQFGETSGFAGTFAFFNMTNSTNTQTAEFFSLTNNPNGLIASVTDVGAFTFDYAAGTLAFVKNVPTTNVPESDTYAMLLAGLGVMGLVARRRLAA